MKNRLHVKLIITVLTATLLSALISGLFQYHIHMVRNKLYISSILQTTAEYVSRLLQNSVYSYDYVTARSIVSSSFSDRNIYYIQIMNTGYSKSNFTIDRLSLGESTDVPLSDLRQTLIYTESPIRYDNTVIGTLKIGMTQYYLRDETRSDILNIILQLFAYCLILIILLFIFFNKIIANPILQITRTAEEITRGNLSSRISINNRDELGNLAATINSMAETIKKNIDELKNTIYEKNLLINELHHRVKNNLSTILGVLDLQAEKSSSREFEQSKNILYSISLVHEQIYSSGNFARINIKEYAVKLLDHIKPIKKNMSSAILHLDIDEIFLNITQATPFGLLLNELINNSLRHVFNKGPKGEIFIEFKKLENTHSTVRLVVSDNREEFDPDSDISSLSSPEITLVNALSEQLKAEFIVDGLSPEGSVITVRFHLE